MIAKLMLILIVFVPIVGSLFLPLFGTISKKLRNIVALLLVSVSVIASFIALPYALGNSPFYLNFNFPLNLNFGLLGDGLAVFMAIISSFIGAIIVFYSFGYISHYKNQNEYYLMVVLFIGSMMGIVYSTNLIFLYIFWEISAICCWRLIGFFREKEHIIKADKTFSCNSIRSSRYAGRLFISLFSNRHI